MLKIIITDDHPVVRGGLKQLVADHSDMELVGEAQDAAELLELLGKRSCDVLVLDISMPGRSGLEVAKEIKSKWPHVAVLMLTMYPEEQYAMRAFRAGAAGYLTKDTAPAELIGAIRRVAAGGKYVTPTLADKMIAYLDLGAGELLYENLSDREFDVLRKLASGRTVGEIANELFLSPNTVSTYRTRLLEKLNLSTTAELIHYAIVNRLVD
jgi:two-component system, NarL family, invasion response regulator UvrY